jgi:hypothetical protein
MPDPAAWIWLSASGQNAQATGTTTKPNYEDAGTSPPPSSTGIVGEVGFRSARKALERGQEL